MSRGMPTERQLAVATSRSLESICKRLAVLALNWEEVDECVRAEIEYQMDGLDRIITDLGELYPKKGRGAA